MAVFRYKAATASGEVVEGHMEAATQDVVIRRLQSQGHVPIRAEEEGAASARPRAGPSWWRSRGVTREDVDIFTLELTTLLGAGLPIDKALELVAGMSERQSFKELVARLHAAVRRGADLSEAMEKEGRTFSPFYLNMVRAGEASGALDLTLARLAEFLERAKALRDTLTSALIYPIILLMFAGLSIALILGVVIPRISEMFDDAGQTLPLPTRIVVGVGDVMHGYWWVAVLVAIGGWLYLRSRRDDAAFRLRWDRRMLQLPMVGVLIAKYEAARFTRTLGTLMQNGVPLLDAIAIARAVLSNRAVSAAVGRVAASVRAGQGLARPLIEAAVFPKLAGHLMQVGEQTGNLEDMLIRLAEIYDRDVETALKRAVDVLGPVLILVLGLFIAGIILSVLAAILSVNELAL